MARGVLLLGESDGVVRTLDAAGSEVWRYVTGGAIGIHMSITPFREGGEPRVFIANNKTGQNIVDANGPRADAARHPVEAAARSSVPAPRTLTVTGTLSS